MKNYYVYRLDDPITNQFYIGSRSCKCRPIDDKKYLGSMVRWNPSDKSRLIKTILADGFNNMTDTIGYEAILIKQYIDDILNENYYIPNKGFHTDGWGYWTGKVGNRLGKPHTEESKKRMSEVKKGKIHSTETRIKMSESHMGRIKTDEHRENLSKSLSGKPKSKEHIDKLKEVHCIPVLQYEKDGTFIKEWKSGTHVVRELGIYHISSVCKGNAKTAGGFIWKYK